MANSDIIKIGFDYRASLAQFEKDTNGVFDGISNKAGKQRITIQLDAKDDKVIDKIKELQKLKLDKFTFEFGDSGLKEQLQTFDKLENKINEIINLGKGKSFIDSSPTVTDIGKIENKINELNKKYEEAQKKLSSIGSGDISGKDVNLVDNAEFQKLTQEVSKLKNQFDDLKIHIQLLDDCTVPTDRFFELQSQVEGATARVSDLVDEFTKLSNAQKVLSSTPQESNISSGKKDAFPNTDTKLDEAVTSAKDLDKTLKQVDIPTDSFDKVLEKLDRTKSELVEIVKITKQSVSDTDGKFHDSYTLKDSRGSTEIYGVNSKTDKGQILRQNIVGYDVKKDTVDNSKELLAIEKQLQKEIETSDKANQKKFQDFQKEQANYEESVNKVNSAIQKTDEILDTLPLHDKLDGQFLDMIDSVDNLNSKLKSGEFTLSEYKNEVKSVTSEYSKMVSIQQKRDVEDYKANAKANLENAKNIKAEWDKNLKAIQDYMDAVTKLNNLKAKDKGTGSEANQIALQTQNVEELKQAAWDARKNLSSMQAENPDIIAWKQWVDMMELFDQASKGSAESAAKLKDVLNNIKVPSLDKYENKLSSYLNKTGGYDATIARFNDGGWTSDTYLKNVQAVRDAVKQYATLLDNIKTNQNGIASDEDIQNLDKYEKKIKDTIATVTNMSASEKGYSQLAGQKEIDKINKILRENSAMSSEAKAKIKAYKQELISGNPSVSLEKIHGEIMKIVNAEELAGRAGRSMFDVIKEKAFYGFAAQIGMYFGFNDIVNGFKQVASTVIDLNTQITDLAKVSEATSSQIYDDFSSYADIAKDIGGTISDTISATADWSRNGYNLPDSKELARVALLYKNVGDGIDIDTANESLISTLRGFKMEADEAEKIIDIFNNVSNNEPIDSGGIGEALQRSAASFNAANTSLQESVALISTTNSVIQNPEKVGNMWKVVSMRIRSATSELEQAGEDTDGLVTSTADLQKMIKAMTGYDILESDGKTFKSIYDIVLNISKVWNNLSDLDQSSLLQALAGKQQSNALAAALSNPELLEKSYQEAMDSAGSAAEEEKKYQQSVQYSIDQTKAKLEELSADLLSSDFLKGAIDAGGKLIDILDSIVKSGNAIPAVATAIAAAFSFKNVGIDTLVAY